MERDLVIARNVFDLPTTSLNNHTFSREKKGRAYCPNTRVLELLDRLWFALDGSFLLVRQLLCNLRRHDTVGCERARTVLSEKKKKR